MERSKGLNQENALHFINFGENQLDETKKLNVYESGFSTVQKKPNILTKGAKHQLGVRASDGSVVNTTMAKQVYYYSTSGQFMAAMTIFMTESIMHELGVLVTPGYLVTILDNV